MDMRHMHVLLGRQFLLDFCSVFNDVVLSSCACSMLHEILVIWMAIWPTFIAEDLAVHL